MELGVSANHTVRFIRIISAILLCIFLNGCKEHVLTLTFEQPVQDTRFNSSEAEPRALSVYTDAINEAAWAVGIAPKDMELVLYKNNVIQVHLESGEYRDEQKAALSAHFESILASREQASLSGQIIAAPLEQVIGQKPLFDRLSFQIDGEGRMEVVIRETFMDAIFGLKKRNAEGQCRVRYNLRSSLPYVIEHDAQDSTFGIVKKNSTRTESFPVRITFTDSSLRQLLDDGTVKTALLGKNLHMGLDELTFIFGSVGDVEHSNREVDFLKLENLEAKCNDQANALGRPFSFFLGDGIDRLTKLRTH